MVSTRSSIFEGNYLFHVHTTFTDGLLTIPDYFKFCVNSGIERIIFLEHVKKFPTYSIGIFLEEIKMASSYYKLPSYVGFEAKILDDGTLDISDDEIETADVIGIAEHGITLGLNDMKASIYDVINNYSYLADQKEIIWVHPGLYLKKRQLLKTEQKWYVDMLKYSMSKGIKIEKNLKHGLVSDMALSNLNHDSVIVGVDAHNISDLELLSHE